MLGNDLTQWMKFLVICILYGDEQPPAKIVPAYKLRYREKIRVVKAVASQLKDRMSTDLANYPDMAQRFQNGCSKFLQVKAPPNVTKLFVMQKTVFSPVLSINVIRDTCDLYMDIEGKASHPLEVTIIAASGLAVFNYIHLYGIPTAQDWGEARYCHGLFRPQPTSMAERGIKLAVTSFIKGLPSITHIYANDTRDIAEFFEQMELAHTTNHLLNDIQYPNWDSRPCLASHQLATTYKIKKLPPPPLPMVCNIETVHAHYKPQEKESTTLNQLAKKLARCHCSLYDTMEVFYHVNKIGQTI